MAELAGISRQSYGAIESGASVPSTEVALRLARALGLAVEGLFRLPDTHETVDAEPVGPASAEPGPMRLYEIGGRQIGVSLRRPSAPRLEPADGVGLRLPAGDLRVQLLEDRPPRCDLVAFGCDPSFELVARALRRRSGVETLWLHAGSRTALEGIAKGHAHVAGIHLVDPETGRYNEKWVENLVPFPCTRVRFASWEQCLIVGAGNPLGVQSVQDLAQNRVRFVNREPGSGSRALIDMCLTADGVPGDCVPGYTETSVSGHFAVAEAVAGGLADAGIAVRVAALAYGLPSVLVAEELYELVIPNHFLEHSAVRALLTLLRTPSLRSQVEALGGYDAEGMGLPL